MFPPRLTVLIAGCPPWADSAASVLKSSGFDVAHCDSLDRYVDDVIDCLPALVLTDGDADVWRPWIATLKAEQGTRRLPVATLASSDERAAAALQAGADIALAVDDLPRLGELVSQYARTPDPRSVERLRQQCAESLSSHALEGIRRFNEGAYYEQHDIFEALWMAELGPVRELYRVILQVGVAYYHITRGNTVGGLKMLRRSAQWFALLPDTCRGVDVRQLRVDATAVRDALRAAAQAPDQAFDLTLLRPVPLVEPAPPPPDDNTTGSL